MVVDRGGPVSSVAANEVSPRRCLRQRPWAARAFRVRARLPRNNRKGFHSWHALGVPALAQTDDCISPQPTSSARFPSGRRVSRMRSMATKPGPCRQRGHERDRGRDAEPVGEEAGNDRADREPEVAPEPVDTDRRRAPGGARSRRPRRRAGSDRPLPCRAPRRDRRTEPRAEPGCEWRWPRSRPPARACPRR